MRIRLIKNINGVRYFKNGNWIDLSNLPKYISGRYKDNIDWEKVNNCIIKFKYQTIEGIFTIINYDNKSKSIIVKYHNNTLKINILNLYNCTIGKILDYNNNNFKYKIGQFIENKNIVIIDRKYDKQNGSYTHLYKYKCNDCGYCCGAYYDKNKKLIDELWVSEYYITNTFCCACCTEKSRIVACGINDIITTANWMVDFLKDKNDAYKYKKTSSSKIWWKCPICNENQFNSPYNIYKRGYTCQCVNKGGSFPEKYMRSVLTQLNVVFETEKIFEWSKNIINKNVNLNGLKKYDFYIPKEDIIIEMNGKQHTIGSFKFKNIKARSLAEELQNDIIKKELANDNNIKHYITIDCPEKDANLIMNNILNSELNFLYDLSIINWNKCIEDSCNNIVKQACDLWEINKYGTFRICKELNLTRECVVGYLRLGNIINWCNYSTEKGYIRGIFNSYKTIYCLELDELFVNSEKLLNYLSNKYDDFYFKESTIKDYIKKNKVINGLHFKYLASINDMDKVTYNIDNNRIDTFKRKELCDFETSYKLKNKYAFNKSA